MSDYQTTLDSFYQEVKDVILAKQHPLTGLLPASTDVNEHGDYRDAWVRDNVYSILAVWGLALAYRKLDEASARSYELEHSVVKLMRGLLMAMMRQSPKLEAFKTSLHPLDALHAKYATHSGEAVVADDAWGHLQLDATALYLLMLAQMTASGLSLIYTLDEVNFVQNLVFYVSQTYRTPDYGIWERGDKTNHGAPELNASSVAMAKAALESLAGFNLFGAEGSQASIIHVLPDDIARASITLEELLPRESASKEVDAALLSAISFPAFAVDDPALVARTRRKIVECLTGHYGLKRFLRDGHQTVLEDPKRLHYEADELKQFEHIESEWPLFDAYLALDGLFSDNSKLAEVSLAKLERLAIAKEGKKLLPELYYVPESSLQAEKAKPASQARVANNNIPLVWAQSLWLLARMIQAEVLTLKDIDPLGRHVRINPASGTLRHKPLVQIALIAEDKAVKYALAARGFELETLADIEPVKLRYAKQLAAVYTRVGFNTKLGLSGRTPNQVLSLATSRIYLLRGETVLFIPDFLSQESFYLSLDTVFLKQRFASELAYIVRHWTGLGRPTLAFFITQALFEQGRSDLLELLEQMKEGHVAGQAVKLAPLNFLKQRAAKERIDDLHDYLLEDKQEPFTKTTGRLKFDASKTLDLSEFEQREIERIHHKDTLLERLIKSENLYEQVELLESLVKLVGLKGYCGSAFDCSAEILLEEVYQGAAQLRLWAILRRSAGLLRKTEVSVAESVSDILVSQKALVIGKAYSEKSLIRRPLPQQELMQKISDFCHDDTRDFVFTQEIIIYLALLMKSAPSLFKGFLTIRIGHLILLLVTEFARDFGLTQDEAYDQLMQLPPSEVQKRVHSVLSSYESATKLLERQEAIQIQMASRDLVLPQSQEAPQMPDIGWWRWRQREGVLNRVPKGFYAMVWKVMQHSSGLVIGDKLDRRNRLESKSLLAEMTAGEKNFALIVDHLLNKIGSADYRQLNIEALVILYQVSELNTHLEINDYLVLDVLIGHAVKYAWTSRFPDTRAKYEQDKATAWAAFYELSPSESSYAMTKAFEHLLIYNDRSLAAVS